jgi:hypothetical protein
MTEREKEHTNFNNQCFCPHVALQFYIFFFCLYSLSHLFTVLFNSCRDSLQLPIVFLRIYIVIFQSLAVHNHANFPQQALMYLYFHSGHVYLICTTEQRMKCFK